MLSDTGKELDRPEALSCTVLDKSIRRHQLVSIQPNRLGQLVLFMVALLLKNTVCGELISGNHPDDAVLL
jgi:hypothetical protein